MKATIELNIADVDAAVREYVQRRAPNIKLAGYTVHSHATEVFSVEGWYLRIGETKKHLIAPDNKELKS